MFSVKVESDKKLPICRGCLSTDRKIVPLRNHLDLFLTLLGVQQEYCETQVFLCWECVAQLKNIQTFQNRIQHAQFVLQQSLYELDQPITHLSTLSIVTKTFYDNTIDYESSTKEKETRQKEFNVKVIKEENSEEDESSNLIIDDTFSDNEILTIDYKKLKQLDIIEDTIKEEPKYNNRIRFESKQSIKRYESKATVKRLKEEEVVGKPWSKVILTEKEIEDILVKDKNLHGFRSVPYKCAECKRPYKRILDMHRHETFNHAKLSFPTKCLVCKLTVSSRDALRKHWERHNVYNKCDLCGWLSHSMASMPKHHRRTHTKVYCCNSCDVQCRDLCGWLSHSMASMPKHHRRTHTKVYCCNSCDVQCRTLREFSQHYKEIHERIICDDCGKSFAKKHSLEVHIKRHHMPATCLECNKTYAHYHVLENHYRMYHPHMVHCDNRTELAYCVECDKQFTSVYKYRRHLSTSVKHTPPKPVKVPCPECGKVFARKIRMTNHFNSVHRNTTKHRCDLCNKTFCSAFSARTHRQHVHDKIPMPKNKICDLCGRGFSTNRILTNHRRTHTGERPYKCGHCPATFAQRTAMKTHERTQHKSVWDTNSAAATLIELGDRQES